MSKHKWKFKSCFRREAYGWNGTAKASKRMKEAVSEVKKIAKKDSALAGQGTVELFVRLYPALMDIDSSSGALGSAIHKTIETLTPILIKADWDMNTRGKWLDKLFEAIQEDGWGTFDTMRDQWGDICVYPGLAHIWADRLIPTVKEVFTSDIYSYFVGTDMCLSCLVYTERYDELKELLELEDTPWWTYDKFWAIALVKQGKSQEALEYAKHVGEESNTSNLQPEIDAFSELVLIDMGRTVEAYEKYGSKIPSHGSYVNIYRNICKKYPGIDKRKILLDCIEKTGEKGKWFAAAKNEKFVDIAVQCAMSSSSDPNTLLRACRDFADENFPFALVVGVFGVIRLLIGTFYDPVTVSDVISAYNKVEKVALDKNKVEDFKALLAREMMKRRCRANLSEVISKKINEGL